MCCFFNGANFLDWLINLDMLRFTNLDDMLQFTD